MTYNVERTDDDDNPWDSRNPQTAIDTIIAKNPDILGVQEDGKEWYKGGFLNLQNVYLSKLTDEGYSCYSTGGNGWENLNIFYKTERFTLKSSGLVFFKKLNDNPEYVALNTEGVDMDLDTLGDKETVGGVERDKGRMFSYVVLVDKSTGIEFLVVNTHFHYGATGKDATDHNNMREYQARILRYWLENDEVAKQYSNLIVMGDLNTDPYNSNGWGRPAMEELTDNGGLTLVRDTALLKGDVGGTLASTSTYKSRDQYVFDHILYRNMTAVEYSVINNMVDEVDGEMRYPSDHLPVMAKFICYAE